MVGEGRSCCLNCYNALAESGHMRPGATQGLTTRHVHVTCSLVPTACLALGPE